MSSVSKPKPVALVSNAIGFAGPPAVQALLDAGFRVVAHDPAFADSKAWADFASARSDLDAIPGGAAEEIVSQVLDLHGRLSVVVSNDHHPAASLSLDAALLEELQQNLEKLVEFPFRLVRAALPALRRQGGGNIVMVTSNRTRLPLSGAAFPDAARAAANAMVRSLAIDCAKDGIIVNAVAPNFLYSEAYYPRAVFKDGEIGRAYVRENVPVGRLAEPHEIGEVIGFLATVKTRFLTGAVIEFSGGWPFGPPRPAL